MVKLNSMRTFRQAGASARQFLGIAVTGVFLCGARAVLAADTNAPTGSLESAYQQAHQQFQADTNNADIAWKLARASFDMSTLQKVPAAEAKYAEEGIAAARRSLALNTNSAPAHYYLGMDIGQLADTKRNLSALRMVKDMEREFTAARDLDKHFDYAGPDRNLGLLYRDAPSFGSVGSRSKARQHLEEAVSLAPEFPENRLNLLEVYLKWDYRPEAQKQFAELEKMWPAAQKQFTGAAWETSWTDWNKRLDAVKKKMGKTAKPTEAPRSQ